MSPRDTARSTLAAGLAALVLVACAGARPTADPGPVAGGDADVGPTGPGARAPTVELAPPDVRTPAPTTAPPTPRPNPTPSDPPPDDGPTSPRALPDGVAERPGWLGRRPLPERPDGHGQAQPTPPELVDRRLTTPPPPGLPEPEGERFAATVAPVPDEVAARSTWRPECPVGIDDLRYVTLNFWGFDQRPHTGELLVHERAADDLVAVFERLHAARFPIEEMRVMAPEDLDASPTGDGNNTSAFECRDIAGSPAGWSQHAYGLAVDVNPFHNPYRRGDLVIPELAGAYLDRARLRPGMIQPGDVVTEAFADIGWGWGGDWRSLDDWMHFSESGR